MKFIHSYFPAIGQTMQFHHAVIFSEFGLYEKYMYIFSYKTNKQTNSIQGECKCYEEVLESNKSLSHNFETGL